MSSRETLFGSSMIRLGVSIVKRACSQTTKSLDLSPDRSMALSQVSTANNRGCGDTYLVIRYLSLHSSGLSTVCGGAGCGGVGPDMMEAGLICRLSLSFAADLIEYLK